MKTMEILPSIINSFNLISFKLINHQILFAFNQQTKLIKTHNWNQYICIFIYLLIKWTSEMSICAWETAFFFDSRTDILEKVRGKQHSFSTHERIFLRKCRSFRNRKCLKTNPRIHANCSAFYPSTAEVGIQRRKQFTHNWHLPLLPVHWKVLSVLLDTWKLYIYIYTHIYTLLAKKVVTPPLKTIKPMWIELLCFHLAEIGMIWTRDCSPTKSDTTLGRHSMQGQVGSSSSETTV